MKKLFLILFFSLSLTYLLNANIYGEIVQKNPDIYSNVENPSNEDSEICYFYYSEQYADGTSVTYYIAYRCGTLAQLLKALP